MGYDSTKDTKEHIKKVQHHLDIVSKALLVRGLNHDLSKLSSPEKEAFDKETPLLASLTYGSEEYRISLERLGVALKHHYENNSHHPEHYENGVSGMCLLDLVEMLADWKAATERHEDGDLQESLLINRGRFSIDNQLYSVLENTAKRLGWM